MQDDYRITNKACQITFLHYCALALLLTACKSGGAVVSYKAFFFYFILIGLKIASTTTKKHIKGNKNAFIDTHLFPSFPYASLLSIINELALCK